MAVRGARALSRLAKIALAVREPKRTVNISCYQTPLCATPSVRTQPGAMIAGFGLPMYAFSASKIGAPTSERSHIEQKRDRQ